MVLPGELYLVKGQFLGKSFDSRPCVVLQVFKSTATIALLSGQLDLIEDGAVVINASDAAFSSSGLRKTSYIPSVGEREIERDILEHSKRLGIAVGKFKSDIEDKFAITL